ncbi:MAG: hypothetical protein KDA24_01485 [Deltaproteobacteria bacterium]|nr:hypothetical protein [Deltaproteobacteria bacterium]
MTIRILALLALSLVSLPAVAAPDVPEPLDPWVGWVLHGKESAACTHVGGSPVCAWPGRLELVLDESGGRFVLDVRADAEITLPLPGDTTHWPRGVKSGSSAVSLGRGGMPSVQLPAGTHRVTGQFSWSRLPESLPVPAGIGLVDLTLRGSPVPNPRRDKDGLLWLQGGGSEEAEEDRLALEVHRRIDDGVPVIVTTRMKLRVSGRSREVSLGTPLLAGTEATFLSSSLPARLDSDGTLQVQLRPGEWELTVKGRSLGPVANLAAPQAESPWPDEETWVFRAAPAVRSVRVDGAPGVDPARTSLPSDWRTLPAWRVAKGTTLEFVELRRGEAQPPPDRLTVNRQLWLSLDGGEFAVRDTINGSIFEGGRIEMLSPGALGRATVAGQDQLITVGSDARGGVEVRDGSLNMTSTSTWSRGGALPAVGWDRDAQSLSANLQLPPGWTLVAASGVDDAYGAWIEDWTLMDLFLVLLIALAVGRLAGRGWGALTLVLLLLCWQEDGALRGEWILLLVPLGRLRALPEGTFRKVTNLARWAFVLVLATQAVVFSWSASQSALFPQLDNYASGPMDGYSGGYGHSKGGLDFAANENVPAAAPVEFEQKATLDESDIRIEEQANIPQARKKLHRRGNVSTKSSSSYGGKQQKRAARLDPQAVVQTGKGLPQWSWTSVRLNWNGPVSAGHEVHLYLTGPLVNGALGILRVLGTILLLLLLADPRRTRTEVAAPASTPAVASALLLLGVGGLFVGTPSEAQAQQGFPSEEMLTDLRDRLTARPPCEPNCAQLVDLSIRAADGGLRLEAEVHADALTAWRLPGPDSAWTPARVQLDGADVIALRRSPDGFLSIRLPEGVHTVVMSGPARDEVGLQFSAAPKVLSFSGDGWTIAGYRPDAPPPGSVQLSRARSLEEVAGGDGQEEAELTPWLQVRRELDLGVPWLAHNELHRLGGGTRAVIARVPLLPGESVTSSGIPVEDGVAIVALEPGETVRRWDSTLAEAETLILTSPEDRPWTEVWSLDCSPIWSCKADGLAPTRHLAEGRWLPRWDPWPGESLTLTLERPPPAEGVTTTLDNVKLSLTSGRRLLESTLQVTLRSSQGGEHAVTLPAGATLRSFQLDGRDHPAQPDGDRLVFAVEPGAHQVQVRWSEDAAGGVMATAPAVDVGESASNVEITWDLPDHRWVLWAWGPRWGPVVTVWQYLLVLILAAFLLAKFAPTPLRGHDWFLLGLGLTQIPPAVTVFLVLWLVALSFRGRKKPDSWWMHDFAQLTLLGMTAISLGILYGAIYEGLVTDPDLGVRGAGSYGQSLHWFADVSGSTLPTPGVLWLPVWCWRVAMLLWALWLASRLLKWLRWGWEQFSVGGLWTAPGWWKWNRKPAAAGDAPAASAPSPPALPQVEQPEDDLDSEPGLVPPK